MKRNITISVFAFACILGLAACTTTPVKRTADTNPNLLVYPGFEKSISMKKWSADGNAAVKEVSNDEKHGIGKHSFKISNAAENSISDAWTACYQTAIDPNNPESLYKIKGGETFTLEAWVKGGEGYNGSAGIKLEFFPNDRRSGYGSGPIQTAQSNEIVASAGDWKKLSVSAQAPDGTVSVVAVLIVEKMIMGSEAVYFDECSLTVK